MFFPFLSPTQKYLKQKFIINRINVFESMKPIPSKGSKGSRCLCSFSLNTYSPPKMNTCPPKRDHFKTKFYLPSINFQGDLFVFGVQGSLKGHDKEAIFVDTWFIATNLLSTSTVRKRWFLFPMFPIWCASSTVKPVCLRKIKKNIWTIHPANHLVWTRASLSSCLLIRVGRTNQVHQGEVSNSSSPWPIPLYWYMSMRTFGWNLW